MDGLAGLLPDGSGSSHGRAGGIAVQSAVNDGDIFCLGCIGGPLLVEIQQIAQVLAPYRTMQRQQHLNIQLRGFLQDALDLRSVFAYDIGVISSGVVQIFFLIIMLIREDAAVNSAPGTESVRGENSLVDIIIRQQDFGPVDHGSRYKADVMLAGVKDGTLLQDLAGHILQFREELFRELQRLHAACQCYIGEKRYDPGDLGAVVGLHVENNKIIQLPAFHGSGQVLKELAGDGGVGRIKKNSLLIEQQIAVIGNAVGEWEQILKTGDAPVAGADPQNILRDLLCIDHVS